MTSDMTNLQRDIEGLNELSRVLGDIDKRIGAKLAAGENFNLAAIAIRNETSLNAIIANLLDPRGDHGQGGVFLKAFLEKIGLAPLSEKEPITSWSIATEVQVSTGRIDICLVLPNQARIYIESKPWAFEGDAQLARYQADLKLHREKHKKLIFMSWPGNSGTTQSKDSDLQIDVFPFHTGQHPEQHGVAAWLAPFASDETYPSKLRHFLSDLVNYLRERIGGDGSYRTWKDTEMTNEMVNHIEKRASLVELVLRIKGTPAELENRVYANFLDSIGRCLLNEPRLADWVPYKHCKIVGVGEVELLLQHKTWAGFPVGIDYGSGGKNRKGGYVGVVFRQSAADETSSGAIHLSSSNGQEYVEKITRVAGETFRKASLKPTSSVNYPAYAYLSNGTASLQNFTTDTYLAIYSGRNDFSGKTADTYVASLLTELALASKDTIDTILAAKPWAQP